MQCCRPMLRQPSWKLSRHGACPTHLNKPSSAAGTSRQTANAAGRSHSQATVPAAAAQYTVSQARVRPGALCQQQRRAMDARTCRGGRPTAWSASHGVASAAAAPAWPAYPDEARERAVRPVLVQPLVEGVCCPQAPAGAAWGQHQGRWQPGWRPSRLQGALWAAGLGRHGAGREERQQGRRGGTVNTGVTKGPCWKAQRPGGPGLKQAVRPLLLLAYAQQVARNGPAQGRRQGCCTQLVGAAQPAGAAARAGRYVPRCGRAGCWAFSTTVLSHFHDRNAC